MKMMTPLNVQVEFSGISRMLTGQSVYTLRLAQGATIREVIQKMAQEFPGLVGEIIETDGQTLIPSNLFSLNGQKILHESEVDYEVQDGDQLILLSLLSGG